MQSIMVKECRVPKGLSTPACIVPMEKALLESKDMQIQVQVQCGPRRRWGEGN
jgi:hypothetical protein